MAESWRVVLASGEVREVVTESGDDGHRCAVGGNYHGWGTTPPAAIAAVVGMHGWPVIEILAPGEPTRAELAARLAAVTAERDVLRAQQAPLLDAHDALVAAARAAGWTGAGATGAELVAWVRREEREACARIADTAAEAAKVRAAARGEAPACVVAVHLRRARVGGRRRALRAVHLRRVRRGCAMSAGHVTLGAEIRAARDACGMTLRALARAADLAPSTLSLAERGAPCIGDAALERICDALAANRPTRERWAALSGRIPEDIERAILDAPERWEELRAWLARGGR